MGSEDLGRFDDSKTRGAEFDFDGFQFLDEPVREDGHGKRGGGIAVPMNRPPGAS